MLPSFILHSPHRFLVSLKAHYCLVRVLLLSHQREVSCTLSRHNMAGSPLPESATVTKLRGRSVCVCVVAIALLSFKQCHPLPQLPQTPCDVKMESEKIKDRVPEALERNEKDQRSMGEEQMLILALELTVCVCVCGSIWVCEMLRLGCIQQCSQSQNHSQETERFFAQYLICFTPPPPFMLYFYLFLFASIALVTLH